MSHPLKTKHGNWGKRSGIIIKITHPDGRYSLGEVAPLSDWGTESLEEAITFLRSLGPTPTSYDLAKIPDSYPCCQFAVSSALQESAPLSTQSFRTALLISQEISVQELLEYSQAGYHTFKIKIGYQDKVKEKAHLTRILKHLPPNTQLRVDANGALSIDEAKDWLELLDVFPVEFLEQPLPVGKESSLAALQKTYQTPIALDESISSFGDISRLEYIGFSGYYVIKPSTLGNRRRIQEWMGRTQVPIVLSSALETDVGIHACLQLAQQTQKKLPDLGLGTHTLFQNDTHNRHSQSSTLKSPLLNIKQSNALWDSLVP